MTLTIRYWAKWLMLHKMNLSSTDFQQVAARWGLNHARKKELNQHYTNFRKQIIERMNTVLNAWFTQDGKEYNVDREDARLTTEELKQMVNTTDKVARIWEPIDIMEADVWEEQDNPWVQLLRYRSANYLRNAAQLIRIGQKPGMSLSMQW